MPFNLGLADSSGLSMRRSDDQDEPPWVELAVRRVDISLREAAMEPYDAGLARLLGGGEHDPPEGNSVQTWVEASTLNISFSNESVPPSYEDLVTMMFDRCLAAINRVIRAELLLGLRDGWVLAKESLDREIAYVASDKQSNLLWLTLHDRKNNPVPVIPDPKRYLVQVRDTIGVRLASDAAAQPHPLVLSRELERLALSQLRTGFQTPSIITLQTAAETYLRGVHRLLLVDAGGKEADVNTAVDIPFMSVIKTALPPLLGGDWVSTHSKPRRYQDTLYDVRNGITHAGKEPTWQQVEPAFTAHRNLVAFVEHQVVRAWKRNPRTLLALTEPWAGGSATPPKAAAAALEALRQEPQPYWLPADLAGR
jgi:hypothetical protein